MCCVWTVCPVYNYQKSHFHWLIFRTGFIHWVSKENKMLWKVAFIQKVNIFFFVLIVVWFNSQYFLTKRTLTNAFWLCKCSWSWFLIIINYYNIIISSNNTYLWHKWLLFGCYVIINVTSSMLKFTIFL